MGVDHSDTQAKARIKELKRAARNDSMGGSPSQIEEIVSLIDIRSQKESVRGGRTMKKKNVGLLAILFFVVLTTAALAQSTAPSDEESRPGSGMMYGQSQGQSQNGYGPGMMNDQGRGQGQGTYGPGMMYGYGAGWMGQYGGIWVTILLAILGAGLVAWIVKRKGQVNRT